VLLRATVNLIVDSSVVLKWFVAEEDSEVALRLRAEHNFSAPDLLLIECHNALLTNVRRRKFSPDEARMLERQLTWDIELEILPSGPLLPHALQLALELDEAIYDCVYLAAAIATERLLISADVRFAAKVTAADIGSERIRLLSSTLA
jgi:predicted nucleic acid-binding protein